MSPARKTAAAASVGITLNHAAEVLRRAPKIIDSLVRREKIVKPHGRPGRGGEYRVDRDALLVLDMAARLEELRVPKPAIKRLIERLRALLDIDGEVALVYAPEGEQIVRLKDGLEALRNLLTAGATVEIVRPRAQRAELEQRLTQVAEPRGRGRPKLDDRWVEKKLKSAAVLGDDETPPEGLARLLGRETRPRRRGR